MDTDSKLDCNTTIEDVVAILQHQFDNDAVELLKNKICRIGKMLVGNVAVALEHKLFEFLWKIESRVLIDKTDNIGCSKNVQFKIDLINPDCKPVQHDVRRCSRQKQIFIDNEIDKLLAQDIIEPILTDWQSGIVVVPKPGPGENFRMCIDYVDLNKLTKTVKFPIPCIEDIMQSLGGAVYFCKLDLAKGYYQIPVHPDSRKYTTFISRKGTFAFKRMPFGPKNAPCVFQQMMNRVLSKGLYKESCVYLDDIIVWGQNLDEVLQRTERVIDKLADEGLILSGIKSEFGLKQVNILGRTVHNGCIYPGIDRLQGLKDLKRPTNTSEVRSIHGLLSHYRSFVKDFAKVCRPISSLLSKEDRTVIWTSRCETALQQIVKAIETGALLLARFDQPFIIYSDFSTEGLGAVLVQELEGKEYPVMFASRKLLPAEEKYSATEGEALAILFALKRFEPIIQGMEVTLRTDHRPLSFVKAGSDHNRKLARWWAELQSFNVKIEYYPGRRNVVADTLSRLTTAEPDESSTFHYLVRSWQQIDQEGDEVVICDKCGDTYFANQVAFDETLAFWYCARCSQQLDYTDPAQNIPLLRYLAGHNLDQLIEEYGHDVFERVYKGQIKYQVVEGKLYKYHDKQWKHVIKPRERAQTMMELHKVFGHCGVTKLLNIARQYYLFPDMYIVCSKVVASCIACQRVKKTPSALPLQPTDKFQQPFKCWAIDFLPFLPETQEGYKHLLLCIDVFSKWVELIPMRSKSSQEVADALELNIYARFGVPVELRMDRGLEFAGKVTQMCDQLGIKRKVISTQHPQANGQAERYVGVVKRCLTTILSEDGRMFADWINVLPSCLMGLRFLQQRVLGYSPFTVIHGMIPKIPLREYELLPSEDWEAREFDIPSLVETVTHIHDEVLQRMSIADMKNKLAFDQRQKQFQKNYQPGDLVLIRNRSSGVFEPMLIGPFEFVRYKQGGRACWLKDNDGREFDCSVAHLVPVEDELGDIS